MTTKSMTLTVLGIALGLLPLTAHAEPLGTAFTYQGVLEQEGLPVSGDFNMVFQLFDAATGGNQVGGNVMILGHPVTEGLFTAELDFGIQVFDGNARWLQVFVESTPLYPRQAITSVPYALYALTSPGGAGYWTASGRHICNTQQWQRRYRNRRPGCASRGLQALRFRI